MKHAGLQAAGGQGDTALGQGTREVSVEILIVLEQCCRRLRSFPSVLLALADPTEELPHACIGVSHGCSSAGTCWTTTAVLSNC